MPRGNKVSNKTHTINRDGATKEPIENGQVHSEEFTAFSKLLGLAGLPFQLLP